MNDPPPDDASRGRQWSLGEMCLLVGWCAFAFGVLSQNPAQFRTLDVLSFAWASALLYFARRKNLYGLSTLLFVFATCFLLMLACHGFPPTHRSRELWSWAITSSLAASLIAATLAACFDPSRRRANDHPPRADA